MVKSPTVLIPPGGVRIIHKQPPMRVCERCKKLTRLIAHCGEITRKARD